jgi:hypothetical protein
VGRPWLRWEDSIRRAGISGGKLLKRQGPDVCCEGEEEEKMMMMMI